MRKRIGCAALVVAAAVAAIGCRSGGGGFFGSSYRECKELPTGKQHVAPVITPADDDFARLLPYRNYYSVGGIGEYEHHFAVWFQCIAPSVTYYAIGADGTVRYDGGAWGGLAVRKGDPPAIPEAQRERAALVEATHHAAYDGEAGSRVHYLGTYREVTFVEVVPDGAPGDPYARMVRHAEGTLRANADLTAIEFGPRISGGHTRMCWEDVVYRDCSQPYWLDFTPQQGRGELQLAALITEGSPQPAAERARFEEAALAAARRKLAGEPAPALDELLAGQGGSLLPPDFAPPVSVGFTIYARAREGAGVEQVQGSLRVELPAGDVLRGVARATATTRVAGVEVTAVIEAAPTEPVPADAVGQRDIVVTLRYRLTDDRGTSRSGEVEARGSVIVDGASAVFRELRFPDEVVAKIHEPPSGQTLPGTGNYTQLDAYFGVSATREPWWFPDSK